VFQSTTWFALTAEATAVESTRETIVARIATSLPRLRQLHRAAV
jgi:hypothetical protein